MATRQLFSDRELAALRGFSQPSRQDLIRFFTLSGADIDFVSDRRGDANRLGVAVQLCTLRWMGVVPDAVEDAPQAILGRLGEQLGVSWQVIMGYGTRPQTRTEHLVKVLVFEGWVTASLVEWKAIDEFLFVRALEHDSPRLLFDAACEFLRASRVVRPGVSHLLEHVATARERADQETWRGLSSVLSTGRRAVLDDLSVSDAVAGGSRHGWLERAPTKANVAGLILELDKLKFLRSIGADRLDLSVLPAQRRRLLARSARRSTVTALARRDSQRRYPMLACLVAESAVEVLDETLNLFDRLLSERESTAKARMVNELAERARSTEQRQRLLDELLELILDSEIDSNQLGALIRTSIQPERLTDAWDNRPRQLFADHGHLDALIGQVGSIRRFAPQVLAAVDFTGGNGVDEVLTAVRILDDLYETGGRHVPGGAPVSFVPARWRSYLHAAMLDEDRYRYRRLWELCVLFALRDRLRSGDIFVAGSRRYGAPTALLMPVRQWAQAGLEHCELIGKPADGHAAMAELETELDDAIADLDEVLADAAEPGEVRLDDNGDLVVPRLSAESVPDGVDALRDAIAHLLPIVTLGSMLVELHARVGLMNHFEHGGGVATRHPDLQRNLIYVIVAEATNIGLTAIARAAGISYDTLAWTADWYLNEDNLQAANQALINYHHQLPITEAFGPGTLSSSDGQRFPVRSQSLTARHMSRYFARGQGISTYTHVSDQHTTFATRVIPATAHESHHVLDDVLGNTSDLPIVEHATDTHGATLANFALFDLVGLRLSPRIRDIAGITLCRTRPKGDLIDQWPRAGPLFTRRANTTLIAQQWDELLRVGASVKHGHVSASLVVSKLCSTNRLRNDLSGALREYGSIRRTIFAARHLADEAERRRTHRQLNKGENLHGLRRAIAYAASTGLRSTDHVSHTEQMGCLTLLTNAVVVWTTEYYTRALEHLRDHGHEVNTDHLAHIWPARHANINVYGIQTVDVDNELAQLDTNGYRPLQSPKGLP